MAWTKITRRDCEQRGRWFGSNLTDRDEKRVARGTARKNEGAGRPQRPQLEKAHKRFLNHVFSILSVIRLQPP